MNKTSKKSHQAIFPLFAIILLISGCAGTVAPKPNNGTMASFDGNDLTSGIIDKVYDSEHKQIIGYIITKFRIDNYNSLLSKYASKFDPPLVSGEGIRQISENRYIMDNQHMVAHLDMIYFKTSGKPIPDRSIIQVLKDKIQ